MKSFYISRLGILFLLLFLVHNSANATKYYTRTTGSWSTASTWSNIFFGGVAATSYPGQLSSNDTVYISGYIITADITPAYGVTSIILNQSNTLSSGDTKLLISTAGITLTCTSFTMSDNNINAHMDLQVSSSAIFQVNGNAEFTRTTNNTRDKRMQLLIMNTARMNVGGNFTYTFGRASNGSSQGNEIQLDNSGRLDVAGAMTMSIGHTSGSNNVLNLVMNNASVLNAGSMVQVLSNTNDGDDILMNFNGGTMNVAGTWTSTVSTTATSGNSITYYIDGGTLSTGDLTFVQSGGTSGDMSIFMNQVSSLSASSFTINGNLVFTHDDGDNMEIETNANSTFTVTGKFNSSINIPSNGDIVFLDLNGGTMSIADSMVTRANSNTSYFQVLLDGGSLSARGIRLSQESTGAGDMYIYLNNGSTAAASALTVGSYGLQFIDNGGDNMDMEVNANSTVTINGDMSFLCNGADGNDRLLLRLNTGIPAPAFTINGNFTGTMNAGTAYNDQIYLDINNGVFTCTGNMTFTTGAASTGGTHCNVEIDGASTFFNVGGTITLNHLGGDNNSNDYIHVGSISDSPSFIAGALVLNGQGGNSTRFRIGNSVVASINGDITLSASAAGKAKIELNSNSTLKIKGDFLRSPSPNRFGSLTNSNSSTVEYNGSGNTQVIAGDGGDGGDVFAYNNIIINNTYGIIPQLSMIAEEGNTTIPANASVTFTNGVVSSISNAMFVIDNNATSSPGNADSYVDGPVKKIGNNPASFTFPVGNDTAWARLSVYNYSGFSANTEFTCQYFLDPAPNNSPGYMGNTVGPMLDHVSFVEYWSLNRVYDVLNDASCAVTLYWEDSSRSKISNLPDLRVAQFQSSGTNKWENHGQGSVSSSGAAGNITSLVDIANFTPITFGSWQGLNPLPVILIFFSAELKNENTVLLKWQTSSEINNDYFIVERSRDGNTFEELVRIEGAGHSTQTLFYEATDENPFHGTSFYRLKQTDFDGTVSYSETKSVRLTKANSFTSVVYPNPASEKINITFNDETENIKELVVLDVFGKTVLRKLLQGSLMELNTSSLSAGVYFFHFLFEGKTETHRVEVFH